jgi:hypothetical protein
MNLRLYFAPDGARARFSLAPPVAAAAARERIALDTHKG